MRVAVLNGVNLDVLHRRDPKLYGGLSLNQLETQIYEWAKELELTRRLPPDQQRGRVHRLVPRRASTGPAAMIVNPGAWTHYSYAIRDALELFTVPVVEVHLSNIDEREDWRQNSVIADVVTCRVIGKGPEGYRDALQYLAVGQR